MLRTGSNIFSRRSLSSYLNNTPPAWPSFSILHEKSPFSRLLRQRLLQGLEQAPVARLGSSTSPSRRLHLRTNTGPASCWRFSLSFVCVVRLPRTRRWSCSNILPVYSTAWTTTCITPPCHKHCAWPKLHHLTKSDTTLDSEARPSRHALDLSSDGLLSCLGFSFQVCSLLRRRPRVPFPVPKIVTGKHKSCPKSSCCAPPQFV